MRYFPCRAMAARQGKTMRGIVIAILTFFSMLLAVAGAQSAERWAELPAFPSMPVAKTSGMADVNDIKMYYAEYGEGEPILFIHGGLGNADVWGHQVADFAKDHRHRCRQPRTWALDAQPAALRLRPDDV